MNFDMWSFAFGFGFGVNLIILITLWQQVNQLKKDVVR